MAHIRYVVEANSDSWKDRVKKNTTNIPGNRNGEHHTTHNNEADFKAHAAHLGLTVKKHHIANNPNIDDNVAKQHKTKIGAYHSTDGIQGEFDKKTKQGHIVHKVASGIKTDRWGR